LGMRACAARDEVLRRSLPDGVVNILFVGRVAPHKKQDDLIRFLSVYRQINPRARLILVGSWGGTERYLAWLKSIAATLGVSAHVNFAGHVSDSELLATYQSAHLFVCLSAHEGFCVPLVEAMALGVPIMAYASTGVPHTLGGAGVLLREKRWDVMAALAETLLNDSALRAAIIAGQHERVKAFTPERVRAEFVAHLSTIGL
ncbi:MAG: glycosyltransferase, partial [Chloroflexota bacterium]